MRHMRVVPQLRLYALHHDDHCSSLGYFIGTLQGILLVSFYLAEAIVCPQLPYGVAVQKSWLKLKDCFALWKLDTGVEQTC